VGGRLTSDPNRAR